MKYLTHLSIVTALLIPAPLVSASNDDDSGLYVGGNYGYLKVKDDDDFDDDNDAYQLIIGGDFNAFIGVEGSYIDFRCQRRYRWLHPGPERHPATHRLFLTARQRRSAVVEQRLRGRRF